MKNYYYSIGSVWQTFDSLQDARKYMKYVIKSDKITGLNRDNEGRFYIVRTDIRSTKTRRYPL